MATDKTTNLHLLTIWTEHENARFLFQKVIDTVDLNEKLRQFNLLVKELSQHEVAEEAVIHPAFRNLTKLDTAYESLLQQETDFSKVLYEMDQRWGKDMDPSINVALEAAQVSLLEHMEYEENNVLAVLERNLPAGEIQNLNLWYSRIKATAPTRPHPSGPRSQIGQLAVGPVLSFVDHFRDLLKDFPSKEEQLLGS